MDTISDVYVAARKGRLDDLLELTEHAVSQLLSVDPRLASCLEGAAAEIRSDIRAMS